MKSFSFALLLLSGSALAQTTITVPLEIINKARPQQYSQVGTSQSTDLTSFRGISDDLTEKVIRSANTVTGQSIYESFLRGELDQVTWERSKRALGRDTLYLSSAPLRHQINILVGTNTAGQRVVIVDANNNRDFSDDKAFTYPMALPQIPKTENGHYTNKIHAVYDTLPAVSVAVEAFDGRQIVQRTVFIKPNPYNSGWTYRNPDENRFHLALLADEYRQANTSILGKPIQVLITTIPGVTYNARSTSIEILEAGRLVHRLSVEPNFQSTNTFVLADHVLEVTGVSLQGDQLTLLDKGAITPTR